MDRCTVYNVLFLNHDDGKFNFCLQCPLVWTKIVFSTSGSGAKKIINNKGLPVLARGLRMSVVSGCFLLRFFLLPFMMRSQVPCFQRLIWFVRFILSRRRDCVESKSTTFSLIMNLLSFPFCGKCRTAFFGARYSSLR